MRLRMCALLALTVAGGCTYPEFEFVPSDASIAADAMDDVAADAPSVDEGSDIEIGEADTGDAIVDPPDTTVPADVASDTSAPDTRDAASTTGADTRDAATDTRDAATDTRDAALDTAPLRFCQKTTHFFCADFDASDIPSFGFTGFGEFGGGALSLQNTSTSSPRGLRVVATPESGATELGAFLSRILTAPTVEGVVRIEADIQVDAATYAGGTLVLLKMQRGGGRGTLLSIGANGLQLEMIGAEPAYRWIPLSKTVTAGVWFHVRFETTLRVTGGSAKVWIDGTQYADETNVSTASADDTYRELIVGFYALPQLLPFAARIDSVTVDFP